MPAAPGAVSQRSRVEVEVTRKDAKPQTHRFIRLETAEHLFITPADSGAYGLLQRRPRSYGSTTRRSAGSSPPPRTSKRRRGC